MATLEKIRNKSVLLFVIIIVALLAFVLGDFLTSGHTYFGNQTTVATAGGAKVEYNAYQKRLHDLSEQQRNQQRDVDSDVLSQQVINQLLLEDLFKQEYDRLGITVTDREITEAMTGENPHPAAAQLIGYIAQRLNLPEASGKMVFDAMSSPTKYGLPAEVGEQLRQAWSQQESDIEDALLSEKFNRLVLGLYTANKLDANAIYDDGAATRHIAYAVKDASSVADDDIEFSDADVQALWKKHKNDYTLAEETRAVDYIYVPVVPSQADRIAARQAVDAAVASLNELPGTDAVVQDTRFNVETENLPLSQIRDAALKAFVDTAKVGSAKIISSRGDNYTIAKLIAKTTGIDSINVSIIQAPEVATLDSIAALLNEGKAKFADVVDNATVYGQEDVWTSLEVPGIDEKVKNTLASAAIGKANVITQDVQGQTVGQLFIVNRRNSPVTFYELADINFTVDPSVETVTELSNALRTYVSNNSSAADFVANATEAGYSVLNAQVTPSSPRIGNVSDSRKFVKWVMEAGKGKVSPLLQDDKQSYFMAVAVTDIYDDGYQPWNSSALNTQLRARALNSKKADHLMAQYAGKANDLAGYAKAMETEVAEGDATFASPFLLNLGMNESAIQGAIAAAEKGKLVGPVKGNHGIIVFEVRDINTENRPFNLEEATRNFNQAFGVYRMQPMQLLLGGEKIDNKSLNFTPGIGE